MTNVLIIEDDLDQSSMLCEYLSAANLQVRCTANGLSALQYLQQETFNIVILDIGLPDIDGFEVCRRIRSFSSLPILMLTARGDAMDKIIGLEIGADDYLAKPFNPRELLARLNAILRRENKHSQQATNLTRYFGRLEINHESRCALLAGETLNLTAYQFDLLSALANHPGRVLSREQLMEALQGHDIEAFDRSIDVHISRIRSQIEDNAKHPKRILTIRGAGYVFAKAQD